MSCWILIGRLVINFSLSRAAIPVTRSALEFVGAALARLSR